MSALYTREMLRLAASTAEFPRLAAPQFQVRLRTPQCGSQILLDIVVDSRGRISAIGMDVHACAVGQAAAAVFANHAVGCDLNDLESTSESLVRWLSGFDPVAPDWPGVDALLPAKETQARHAAIMLAFNAGVRALRDHADAGRLDAMDAAARAAAGPAAP